MFKYARPNSFSPRLQELHLPVCIVFFALLVFLGETRPVNAAVINVSAGGNLQQAINSAQPGDTIILAAGATFIGPFTLPYKAGTGTDADYITIQSSALANLPEGVRVSPLQAPHMPKLLSPGLGEAALQTQARAHHWRLLGLEIARTAPTGIVYELVKLGDGGSGQNSLDQVPHHIVIDRCFIHGDSGPLKRGISLQSASTDILNSYLSDFHVVGQDTQAVCGWNGPGPYRINNNYLEGAGENVMFGGAPASIPGLVPTDIEFRRNHVRKPPQWRGVWSVKNLFELKNARRIVIDGNIFENNWLDAQQGYAIVFTPRPNDSGAAAVVEDVHFTNNIVRNVAAAMLIAGQDSLSSTPTATVGRRIRVVNNLFYEVNGPLWGGDGAFLKIGAGVPSVVIDHNTVDHTGNITKAYGDPMQGFAFTNNLTSHNDYGIMGDSQTPGLGTLNFYMPGYTVNRNVIAGESGYVLNHDRWYPADNFYPTQLNAAQFVDRAAGNYRLQASSPYVNAATDGKNVGCDFAALDAAISGTSPTPTPTPAPTPTPTPTPAPTPTPTPAPTPTPTPTPDTGTPSTSITSPVGGTQFNEVATITITAVAADVDGTVARVEFFSGTTLIGTDATAPYSFVWSGVGAGTYALTTKATDNSGRSGKSAEIRVQVKRASGSVNRAKKNAQSASNQLSDPSSPLNTSSSEGTYESSTVVNRLSSVVADIEHAYDDFRLEQNAYAVAGKIDIDLQNALNYARSAESSASAGISATVESNLRKAIDHLELASVHMLHGDVANPLVVTEFFVRQHYVDFLNREPDEAGLNFWAGEIARCGADAQCTQVARINVSAAFFLSIEFRESGYLAYRLHKASFGQMPAMTDFSADSEELRRGVIVGQSNWTEKIEANKAAFYQKWVERRTFLSRYGSLTNSAFVDAFLVNTSATVSTDERDSWVTMLNGGVTRDIVLRRIVEREEFARKEVSAAFVMMQYIGYLRRDPDAGGFSFWLDKLNQFGGDYARAEMVRAFIESIEYNERFANR